jgi:hypothetical protein
MDAYENETYVRKLMHERAQGACQKGHPFMPLRISDEVCRIERI